jgi:ankyrin repeat protein
MVDKTRKPTIFISYAHEDEAIVQKLQSYLQKENFDIIIDKGRLTYGGSIYDLMKEFDSETYFVVLISDGYLKSKYCMREFAEISRGLQDPNKCFPLTVKSSNLFSLHGRLKYMNFWEGEIDRLEGRIKDKGESTDESNLWLYDLHMCSNNKNGIPKLFSYLTNTNVFSVDVDSDRDFTKVCQVLTTKLKIDNQKALDDNAAE